MSVFQGLNGELRSQSDASHWGQWLFTESLHCCNVRPGCAATIYRCIWCTCATTQRGNAMTIRAIMQRMHSSAGMPGRQIKIYTGFRRRHERGMPVSICARKIIDTSFPGGITDRISSRTHTPHVLKHFAFEWLHGCRRLMRLTSELGEEASRNAHYSKCLCTGEREAPLSRQDTWSELAPPDESASFLLLQALGYG